MISLYKLINIANMYNYEITMNGRPAIIGNNVDELSKSNIYQIIKQPTSKNLNIGIKVKRT